MSLRVQLALLFLAGGLVLSDAAQASPRACDAGTFSAVMEPDDRIPTEGAVDGPAKAQHAAEG